MAQRSTANPPATAPMAIPRLAVEMFRVIANAGAAAPAIVTRTWLSVTPAVWTTPQTIRGRTAAGMAPPVHAAPLTAVNALLNR